MGHWHEWCTGILRNIFARFSGSLKQGQKTFLKKKSHTYTTYNRLRDDQPVRVCTQHPDSLKTSPEFRMQTSFNSATPRLASTSWKYTHVHTKIFSAMLFCIRKENNQNSCLKRSWTQAHSCYRIIGAKDLSASNISSHRKSSKIQSMKNELQKHTYGKISFTLNPITLSFIFKR